MRCVPRVLIAKNARSGAELQDADLADLAQEAFALIWQRASEFRGEASLETWATSFTLHLYANAVRRAARKRTAEAGEPETNDHAAEEQESRSVLRDALATLDPRQAAIVRLRQLEGLGFDEIAHRLDLPVGTAKSRYSRALAALRRMLEPKKLRGAI